MGNLKFTDNAETKLTGEINDSDDPVTFSVTGGDGALFPILTGDNWFPLVIVDAAGNYEKLRVIARTIDSLTAERSQGGTTKMAFAIGDACFLATTAEFFNEYLQTVDIQEGKPHWCGLASGSANIITLFGDPTIEAYAPGQLLTFKAQATNTDAVVIDTDGLGVRALVDLSGAALIENAILIGGHYFIQDDGTQYVLMNSVSNTFADLTVTGTLTLIGSTIDILPALTRMLFQQEAAPPGWTIDATVNDYLLRLVDGSTQTFETVDSPGGDDAFTTAFSSSKATESYTLLIEDIPAHTHDIDVNPVVGASNFAASSTGDGGGFIKISDSTGGGGGHAHDITLDPSFVDVIIAVKD